MRCEFGTKPDESDLKNNRCRCRQFFFRVDRKIGIIGESKGRGVLGMRASLLVRFSFNFMQFSGETCQNKRLEMAPSLTRPSAKSWIRPTDPSSSSRSGSCHYHPSPNHHNPGPGKICFNKDDQPAKMKSVISSFGIAHMPIFDTI